MDVHLRVIGCSPAWPNPGGANAGYLVTAPGAGSLMLDCGPGVLARLRAAELLPVDAVAITHLHLDHWGDLVPWCWLARYAVDSEGSARPALWLPPDGIASLAAFGARFGSESMFADAFTLAEYARGVPFEAAGFHVRAITVEHYTTPAYGFRVAAPDGTVLGYSGDTAPCAGLGELSAGAALFLCEATLAEDASDGFPRGHLRASEALAAANGRTLLTHRPAELGPPSASGLLIGVARDGDVLEVGRA